MVIDVTHPAHLEPLGKTANQSVAVWMDLFVVMYLESAHAQSGGEGGCVTSLVHVVSMEEIVRRGELSYCGRPPD